MPSAMELATETAKRPSAMELATDTEGKAPSKRKPKQSTPGRRSASDSNASGTSSEEKKKAAGNPRTSKSKKLAKELEVSENPLTPPATLTVSNFISHHSPAKAQDLPKAKVAVIPVGAEVVDLITNTDLSEPTSVLTYQQGKSVHVNTHLLAEFEDACEAATLKGHA
jgi:hypothetical protein